MSIPYPEESSSNLRWRCTLTNASLDPVTVHGLAGVDVTIEAGQTAEVLLYSIPRKITMTTRSDMMGTVYG